MDHLDEIKRLGEISIDFTAKMLAFFEFSHDLNCIAKRDGCFRAVNQQWVETLGWSKQELLSRPWLEFLHPDDVQSTIDAAKEMEGKTLINFSNRYRCKDGSFRRLLWKTMTWDRDGEALCIAKDITDEKKYDAGAGFSEGA